MIYKYILTAILVAAYWLVRDAFFPAYQTIVLGANSVLQLNPSDAHYLHVYFTGRFVRALPLMISVIFAAAICVVWWDNIKSAYSKVKAAWVWPIMAAVLCLVPNSADAYYSKTNFAETMIVLPNQSAFLVPEVGDNLTNQAQFSAAQYRALQKIGQKRIDIPHVQLQGSSWYANYYVPAARLIIVDRPPFYREWTASTHTGTSNKDQSFNCESADSINVSTAIAISARITEEGSADYLYVFGVEAPFSQRIKTDEAMTDDDGKRIFSSVLYARSLEYAMEGVVHGAIKTALCNEMGSRKLIDLFANKAAIMDAVNKQVKAMYATQGITIDYIGYAAPLDYDPDIQKSINEVFIATKKNEQSIAIKDSLPVLSAQADIQIKSSFAKMLETRGLPPITLPSFMLMPTSFFDWLYGWFSPAPKK